MCLAVSSSTTLSSEASVEAISDSITVNSTGTGSLSVSNVVVEVVEDVVVVGEELGRSVWDGDNGGRGRTRSCLDWASVLVLEIFYAQGVHHLAWLLTVNDSSLEHKAEVSNLVAEDSLDVGLEEVNSSDKVIVGLIGVSDGIVTRGENIVHLLGDETHLVGEWSCDLKQVLGVDLIDSLVARSVHSSEVVDSSSVSLVDIIDDTLLEGSLIGEVITVDVGLDTVVTVVVILIFVVLEAAIAIGVAIVARGTVVNLSESCSNESSKAKGLHCISVFFRFIVQ